MNPRVYEAQMINELRRSADDNYRKMAAQSYELAMNRNTPKEMLTDLNNALNSYQRISVKTNGDLKCMDFVYYGIAFAHYQMSVNKGPTTGQSIMLGLNLLSKMHKHDANSLLLKFLLLILKFESLSLDNINSTQFTDLVSASLTLKCEESKDIESHRDAIMSLNDFILNKLQDSLSEHKLNVLKIIDEGCQTFIKAHHEYGLNLSDYHKDFLTLVFRQYKQSLAQMNIENIIALIPLMLGDLHTRCAPEKMNGFITACCNQLTLTYSQCKFDETITLFPAIECMIKCIYIQQPIPKTQIKALMLGFMTLLQTNTEFKTLTQDQALQFLKLFPLIKALHGDVIKIMDHDDVMSQSYNALEKIYLSLRKHENLFKLFQNNSFGPIVTSQPEMMAIPQPLAQIKKSISH